MNFFHSADCRPCRIIFSRCDLHFENENSCICQLFIVVSFTHYEFLCCIFQWLSNHLSTEQYRGIVIVAAGSVSNLSRKFKAYFIKVVGPPDSPKNCYSHWQNEDRNFKIVLVGVALSSHKGAGARC